jgi:thiamine-monophosphate kinase
MGMVKIGGEQVLAAVDQCVVGRHCRPDAPLRAVGRKAVLRNLSDVAAMAARPVAILASATLTAGTTEADAEELYEGLRTTGAEYGAPLIGGDLSIHANPDDPIVVSVTILARPALPEGRVIRRNGMQPGDLLAVTGKLGGSLGSDGGGRHLDFQPRIEEAIQLGNTMGNDLVAMIDLSDGLASDAQRLIESNQAPMRCILNTADLPIRDGLDWRRAVGDGEDYELLFACRQPPPQELNGLPITVVGRIESHDPNLGTVLARTDAGLVDLSGLGWEHGSDS